MRTKRDRNCVHPTLDGELQVLFVFGRQRRYPYRDAGQIDALMLSQHAAVDDFAFRILSVHRHHVELDEPVGEQDARPRFQIFRQRREGSRDQRRGPGNIAWGDRQPLAGLQLHRDTVFEPAGADLRSLQIAQDADRLAFFA